MKTIFQTLTIMLFCWSCTNNTSITLTNTSDYKVTGKSIEIPRAKLEQLMGKLPETDLVMLSDSDGNKYPGQLDDLDGDKHWDVLFTQVDLDAKQEKSFKISFNINEEIPVKTNIRFANINDPSKEITGAERLKTDQTEITQQYFQFEGPGWENDLVAFRNYFDARNGMDIFGKTTNNMALDSCGLKGGPSYHELQPWGMDILKVGNSLGAGAIALQSPTGLYRVGPDCNGTYSLVKEGPIRSIFDLDFRNINIDGKNIILKHRISIEAGKPYYKSQVSINGYDELEVVTGIVNMNSKQFQSINTKDIFGFYTYDNQAYNGEQLGMGILIPGLEPTINTAPDDGDGIIQTYYVAHAPKNIGFEFYFMAGWELQDAKYNSIEGFSQDLLNQMNTIAATIELK